MKSDVLALSPRPSHLTVLNSVATLACVTLNGRGVERRAEIDKTEKNRRNEGLFCSRENSGEGEDWGTKGR